MVAIVAKLKAKPGKEKELEEVITKLTREVRDKEQDCIMYEPYVLREDPSEIMVIEKYKNDEAIDYHRSTSHYIAAKEKFQELLREAPEVNILDELS